MRITLYLLRDGTKMTKGTLRNAQRYIEWAIQDPPDPDLEWRLFVRQAPAHAVGWLSTLAPIMVGNVEGDRILRGQSAGAVLLVRSHGRLFAITFGTGYHAIDQSIMEPDFGLRVAANSIDPRKIKIAEARGMDKGMRNAVSSMPVPNEIFALGLSTNEEWIRRLGGKVQDGQFAVSIAGADSLRLSIEDFDLRRIDAKLGQVLNRFNQESYKGIFPFLDYFRRLPNKDPLVATLDAQLLEEMRSRSEQVGFAAPDEFEFASPDYYKLRKARKTDEFELAELTTEAVYGALDKLGEWTDPLRRVTVAAFGGADYVDNETAPLGRYAVANLTYDLDGITQRYARTAGAWFRIDQDYVETLERFMTTVPDITTSLAMPSWDDNWLLANIEGQYGEDRYNRHVGKQNGFAVLDRDFYRNHARAGQQVEVCDLLTPDKQLVCVKRLDGAERLSHLFQQGSVSARLMPEKAYQAKILEALATIGGSESFGDRSDWTFVFAIATSKQGKLQDILTFFGKVALMTHAEAITGLGYKVALAKITRE